MPRSPVIVYRGQLHAERSRIEFLLSAVSEAFDRFDFVYLAPSGATPEVEVVDALRRYPKAGRVSYIEAPRGSARRVRRTLEDKLVGASVIAIGFRTPVFVPRARVFAWCVNGIPEERLLHSATIVGRLAVRGAWLSARRRAAGGAVTVSAPMAALLETRCGLTTTVVPNAVDRSVFFPTDGGPRTHLTYQGGGSPWQGLGTLSEIWAELHALDPTLRFRVISKDPRTRVLIEGLDPVVAELLAADTPDEMARLLSEASLGFLVREPNLVNRVSSPMKLGEYLAAGARVVLSSCGWDAEHVVTEHDAGLVLDWNATPALNAARILAYLDKADGHPSGVGSAAAALDAETWRPRLAAWLLSAYGRAEAAAA